MEELIKGAWYSYRCVKNLRGYGKPVDIQCHLIIGTVYKGGTQCEIPARELTEHSLQNNLALSGKSPQIFHTCHTP